MAKYGRPGPDEKPVMEICWGTTQQLLPLQLFFFSFHQSFPGSWRSTCCYCSRCFPAGRPSWENTAAGHGSVWPHHSPIDLQGGPRGPSGFQRNNNNKSSRASRTFQADKSRFERLKEKGFILEVTPSFEKLHFSFYFASSPPLNSFDWPLQWLFL